MGVYFKGHSKVLISYRNPIIILQLKPKRLLNLYIKSGCDQAKNLLKAYMDRSRKLPKPVILRTPPRR